MNSIDQTIGSLDFDSGTLTQGTGVLTLSSSATALDIAGGNSITGSLVLSGTAPTVTLSGSGNATLSGAVSLNSGSTTFSIPADTLIMSGTISGAGGVSKTGGGTLSLQGTADNSYSLGSTVSAGIVSLNSSNIMIPGGINITGTGTLTLSNNAQQISTGATMTLQGSGTFNMGGFNQTLSSLVFQDGTLTQGIGVLNLSNNGTALTMRDVEVTGAVSLSGGSSQAVIFDSTNNGTATISGSLNMGGNTTTFTIGNGTASSDMNVSGTLTNGAVTKGGLGLLTFSGSTKTYSGDTTIVAGTLSSGAANVFPSATTVVFPSGSTGTLDLNNNSNTIRGLSSGAASTGTVLMGSATLTVAPTTPVEFTGTLSGTSGFAINGTSTQTLSGATKAYSGDTTITSGTLASGTASVLPSATTIVFPSGSTGTLNLNGNSNTVRGLSSGAASTGTVLMGGAALTVAPTTPVEFTGTLSGTGGFSINGTSTQTLSGATKTYSGDTTIASGTLSSGAANVFPSATTVVFPSGSTGTLDLNGNANTIRGLSSGAASTGTVLMGGAALTVAPTTPVEFTGTLSGTSGFAINGTSTQTLSGITKTYTGDTTILAGTLSSGTVSVFPSATTVVFPSGSTGTLDLNGNSNTVRGLSSGAASTGTVLMGGAALTVAPTTPVEFTGTLSGTSGFSINGTSTQTLSGATKTYSGDTTIASGTLSSGAANVFPSATTVVFPSGSTGTLDLNSNSNTIRGLSSGAASTGNVLMGSATLTVAPTTPVEFTGTLSGTSGFAINGTSTQTLSGATKTYTGDTTIVAGTLSSGAANVFPSATTVVFPSGSTGTLDLNGNTNTIRGLSSGAASTGTVLMGGAALTVAPTTPVEFTGTLSGTSGFSINGTSTQTLSGATKTYTGDTTIVAGTLSSGTAAVFPTSTTVVFPSGSTGTLDLNDNTNTVRGLSSGAASTGNVLMGSATLTVAPTTPVEFTGTLSGTSGFSINGTSTQTLSGATKTYTGDTTIVAGNSLIWYSSCIPNLHNSCLPFWLDRDSRSK